MIAPKTGKASHCPVEADLALRGILGDLQLMTLPNATESSTPCVICGTGLVRTDLGSSSPRYPCRVCGPYQLAEYAAQHLYEAVGLASGRLHMLADHHLFSAVIRERVEITRSEVHIASFEELRSAARPLPDGYLGSVDRLLIYVGDHIPRLGQPVRLVLPVDYPLAYARDGAELGEILKLGGELGYLRVSGGGDDLMIVPTPDGWRRLQDLRTRRAVARQAFVAMWFGDEMSAAFADGFAPALEQTGYRPVRIDRVEHNDKVDDRIVAAIRQSGLVVADFTGGRGGVYFEAGLAQGLGLPVIWTCRRDYFDREGVHFDTRKYKPHFVGEPWRPPRAPPASNRGDPTDVPSNGGYQRLARPATKNIDRELRWAQHLGLCIALAHQ